MPKSSPLAADQNPCSARLPSKELNAEDHMTTSSFYKWVLTAALAVTVASAGTSYSQTYTDLFNFDGIHGATPSSAGF